MFTLPHLLRIAHPAAALRNDVQRRLKTAAPTASLPVQVWADGEAATVRAALPGYALEDIGVEVHERTLRLLHALADTAEVVGAQVCLF